MLEKAQKILSVTGRVLMLRSGESLSIPDGSLRNIIQDAGISERDIRKVLKRSTNIGILSVEDVITHDVPVPLMRINARGNCAWSSPKYIRTIRGALAVV